MQQLWSADPDEVVAAVPGCRPWTRVVGCRTCAGLRLLVPGRGLVIDAAPTAAGDWVADVYRMPGFAQDRDEPVDVDVFLLAFEVWSVQPREPERVLLRARPALRLARGWSMRPGQDVVLALLDAAEPVMVPR